MSEIRFEMPNARPMIGASNPNAKAPTDPAVIEVTMPDGTVARVTTRQPAQAVKP
ncbi:hypothetical protein [Falsiroseomonas tokyonensis]|uniref:hypothetical protein n=1 Tax=Falsiroseomonas tokyonensis TaxID=430521 RepID=UPI001C209A0D|nr:hypothetical protein [Falsiroseomonas tokyonensis]